ncbi:MAG TPA: hypothetical protein VKV16_05805 [Solirubrobacteraceae bacterium]|nr:hypothetical protein [Solirubrobacteraceae bacterium]
MLFDLRGRGRRSVVKVIYLGLAAIFLLGFIGLGVGGGFGSTGILSSLTGEGSSGGGGNGYSAQVSKYRKLTKREPHNVSAWENLAKYLDHEGGNEPYTTSAGVVTSKGKELFKQVSQAWQTYIALNPPKPNAELAQLMESVYSETGLNEPSKEVEVLQIAIATRPTDAALYAALAEYSYKAHNTREGDLASEKAVALSPASERKRVQRDLAEVKANPSGEKTYTTTTNGKTYTGKLNSKGELTATEVKTTGSSKSSTSTGKK